jgi:transposase
MTKPYSLDLRERVTERVAAGDSVRAVATIFTVSVASVVRWSQRLRRTGSAAGGKMGGHRACTLIGERGWLMERTTRSEGYVKDVQQVERLRCGSYFTGTEQGACPRSI